FATLQNATGTGTIQDEPTDNVVTQKSTIMGKVFVDGNGNGTQDGLEQPLVGIVVNLTGTNQANTAVTLQTTTGVGGAYAFANLDPGTYTVKFVLPNQYQNGQIHIGSQGGTEVATHDGFTFTITSPGGVNGTGNDFTTHGFHATFASLRQLMASF